MIKAVFFDLYNTLARFYPPREVVQAQAGKAFGLDLGRAGIVRGYMDADEFMTRQNARVHVARLSLEDRLAFFARYEQLVLQGAGIPASLDLAAKVWDQVRRIPYGLALYDDALPCLAALKERELVLGLITNVDGDLAQLCRDLGLTDLLDVAISSGMAGAEKPHPRIFQAALAKAGVGPSEALHVGDQYNGDVVGARAAGMHPVLLDREGLLGHYTDVRRIKSLDDVQGVLAELA